MSKGEGRRRLLAGVVRPLTPHEWRRGYVYATQDPSIEQILDGQCFTVVVAGKAIPNRRIDVSGRVHIPGPDLAALGHGDVVIMVDSERRLIIHRAAQASTG